MKKYYILGILILIGITVLIWPHNSLEYSSIVWTGEGRYRTYDSREGTLLIGDSVEKKIIGRIDIKKVQAVLIDDENKERYEMRERIINPQRKEVYVLFADKESAEGPYVGASVHVIASRFDGTMIKDIVTLEGYDIPNVTLSEDGAKLHIEQLMKRGSNSDDIVLEKFDLDIENLMTYQ